MDEIKVLVCDDMPAICEKIRIMLDKDPVLSVVGTAGNGYDAVLKAVLLKPDVILMDIEMESKTAGIKATEEIMKSLPNSKIIILTVYVDSDLISQAYQAGAMDYLMKSAPKEELIKGIKDAYAMKSAIRPDIAKYLLKEFKLAKSAQDSLIILISNFVLLTPSEREILLQFHEGKTRNEVAEERFVELSTLKTQINSILRKMKKSSIEEVLLSLESMGLSGLLTTGVKQTDE